MENELETKKDGLERFFLYIEERLKEELTTDNDTAGALGKVRENVLQDIKNVFGEALGYYGENERADILEVLPETIEEILSFSEKIFKEIRSVLTPETKKYFAIPSNELMFLILPLFAGLTKRIPKKLLTENYNSKEAKEYIDSVLDMNTIETKDEYYQPQTITKTVAILQDTAKHKATANIPERLFNDIENREADLALRLKQTFGAKGIKHFLGYLLQLDEHGRNGRFIFSVNKQLQLLGYKRYSNRDYDPEEKELAGQIFDIMTSISITIEEKDRANNGRIVNKPLFVRTGDATTITKGQLSENTQHEVLAQPFWYGKSFTALEGKQSQQYTKLLKKIVKESAKEHPITLYLAPLFAVKWRIDYSHRTKCINWKLSTLLEWIGEKLDGNTEHRKQKLRHLETEFEYMKANGYLGEWNTGNGESLSYKNLDEVISFFPPKELEEQLEAIATKREKYIESATRKELTGEVATVTKEEFLLLMKRSGLNQKQFANTLGISPALISKIKKGEKPISKELNFRLLELRDELKINS